jgi:hypothetical protein
MNLALKKCQNDVWYEGSDRHESEIFETQILVKFQPKWITESKVMTLGKSLHHLMSFSQNALLQVIPCCEIGIDGKSEFIYIHVWIE